METHVKVVGALHVVLGALGLVGVLVLIFVFGGAASIVGASGDPDAARAVPIIGLVGTFVVVLTFILSLPGLIIGVGLLRLRPWSRVAGIVLSILDLMWIPFGTVVGVYGLFVLFSKDTERLFAPVQKTV